MNSGNQHIQKKDLLAHTGHLITSQSFMMVTTSITLRDEWFSPLTFIISAIAIFQIYGIWRRLIKNNLDSLYEKNSKTHHIYDCLFLSFSFVWSLFMGFSLRQVFFTYLSL